MPTSSLPKEFDLHGNPVTVIASDLEDTIVQYANGAQRHFDTGDLFAYMDAKVFPPESRFVRAVDGKQENITIKRVVEDSYEGEKIECVADYNPVIPITVPFADFIKWHMDGDKLDPEIELVPGSHLYTPKIVESAVESAEDTNPFEEDLQKENERLRKEILEFKRMIAAQKSRYDIIIAGYEEDMVQLEKKAAIINPAPTFKQYCVKQGINETLLNKLAGEEGWQIQSSQFMNDDKLNVILVRDLPAAPAPKVVEKAEAAHFIGAVQLTHRTPVPVTPANNTVLHQPVSRDLTNNRLKAGDTKRIPTPADIETRRQKNADEINEIVQRGLDANEALRKRFANSPRSFNRITGAR